MFLKRMVIFYLQNRLTESTDRILFVYLTGYRTFNWRHR